VYSGGDEKLQEFIDGSVDFTISTNVVGRGVSASGLSNVVIFDYPQSLVELQQTSMRAGFCFSSFFTIITPLTLSG
jgi:superfamily II DNA/RNA helicase